MESSQNAPIPTTEGSCARRKTRSSQRRDGGRRSGVRSESQGSKKRSVQGQAVASKSQSRGSSHPRTRSRSKSKSKYKISKISNKGGRQASCGAKSPARSIKHNYSTKQPAKKSRVCNFERQVSLKFRDLGKKIETDKEDLVNKLAQLSKKVSKI